MLKKIEHTAIIVQNIKQGIQFYTEALGFQLRAEAIVGKKRKIAFLFLPEDPQHEVELIEELIRIDEALTDGAINHLAFTVENIEQTIIQLQAKGVQFETAAPSMTATGAKTIFFRGAYKELLQLIEK